MKTPACLLLALASCGVIHAQTTTTPPAPAQPPVANKAAPAVKTAAPAAKTAPAPNAAKKKEEPPAKIEGTTIPRGKKFLGIQIVNGTFKLSFYDEKKKPVTPDAARAVLRWDPKYKVGKERLLLSPSEDGKSLTSPKTVRPPYNFKLFITLLNDATDAEEPVGETFVIDFQA